MPVQGDTSEKPDCFTDGVVLVFTLDARGEVRPQEALKNMPGR